MSVSLVILDRDGVINSSSPQLAISSLIEQPMTRILTLFGEFVGGQRGHKDTRMLLPPAISSPK